MTLSKVFQLIVLQSIFCLSSVLNLCTIPSLVVNLPNGRVRGASFTSPSGRNFYFWKGIPFAKPPLGDLRFKPPVNPEPWTGILDGSQEPKACLFVGTFENDPLPTNGHSEDCLYINIYSPYKANSNLSLPVIFYIYGGGFIDGAADSSFTDPTAFLDEEVIFVMANYRLSLFGFLSTEDSVISGNSALKDQLAALKWTRDNVAYFGGNPNDITLFGHSVGASSAGYHLLSPLSRGLFAGVIFMSSTCLNRLIQRTPRENALKLASLVNSSITSSSTSEEIVEALQLANADVLVNLTLELGTSYRTVLEVNSSTSFITEPFYETLESGNFHQVPILIGTTSMERIGVVIPNITYGTQLAAQYDANSTMLFPSMILKEGASIENVTSEIKEAYVGPNGTFVNNLCAFATWTSDNGYSRGIVQHAILQSRFTTVYFYESSFEGTLSAHRVKLDGCGRVGHADDLGYLFNISTHPIATDADFLTRRRFVKLFSNFVKYKNPTPNDDSSELLQNTTWLPFDENNLQYFNIGENLEFNYGWRPNTTQFWQDLWANYSALPYGTF